MALRWCEENNLKIKCHQFYYANITLKKKSLFRESNFFASKTLLPAATEKKKNEKNKMKNVCEVDSSKILNIVVVYIRIIWMCVHCQQSLCNLGEWNLACIDFY